MKLIAFIEKTASQNEMQIILKFYGKSIATALAVCGTDGDIQMEKYLPIKDFFDTLYFPSNDSNFLETPYSSEINRIVEPLIDDALTQMTELQRYEFAEEMFKTISKENQYIKNKEYLYSYEATCHAEKDWPTENKRDPSPYKQFFSYKNLAYKKFCWITHNCILTEQKIRKIFYKESFRNGYKLDLLKKFSSLAYPLQSDELIKLIDCAPEVSNIEEAANFAMSILEFNPIDFNDKAWIKMIEYTSHHRSLCLKKITAPKNFYEELKISDIINKYLEFIPPTNFEDVSFLIKEAPLSSNLIAAKRFIEIIIEHKVFNPQISIWNEMIDYIEKYKFACIETLNKTNDLEEYELILETSLNNFIWENGSFEFREILINRIEHQNTGSLYETIQSFTINNACSLFPDSLSIKTTERLIKHFSSHYYLYEAMSTENQLQLFNLYSAITCQKILLTENETATKVAIDYANDRMIETMRSVKWDVEKAIKKSTPMLKRNEHRAVAALINKIVADLNYYFSKSVIAEIYSELLLPHNPHYDWVALCENLPFINSSFSIREGLARYFLSNGDVAKARPHVAAIMSFEPNSKIAAELHSLLSRETAIKSLAEDGVDIETIDKMTGIEFEKILIKKLQKIGFKVTETPGSGDYGADIVIDDEDETRFIIQCKRFSSKVNLKAVQEIVAAMKHYSADYAIVATNNEFLKSAVELAKSNDVELWTGTKVMQVLSGDISSTVLATATLPEPIDEKPLETRNISINHI